MSIVTGQREAALLLKTVKRMIYLSCVLFRYVLIYNLEVSFNFHLTFEDISTIKCDENVHCAVKTVFFPYSRLFSSSSR